MQGKIQRSFIFIGGAMANREVGISSVVELGEILRAVRKESGLTQRDAAALCNVSLPFLNGLEQGKPTAQIGKVLSVCSRFGIDVRLRLPGETA
jgi:HTH-type transcriptional regulator/antitoxin HipB